MPKQRSWSTFALLAVAVVALVVGSVGTASAGGLTKGAVKKIATKVVKKQSSGLSVASAASAGNANTVGGFAASALQEQRSVFTVTVNPAKTSIKAQIPLPGPGSYEITYSAFLSASASTTSECWIEKNSAGNTLLQYYADDASSGTTSRSAHSASDVVTTAAGDKVLLGCTIDSGTFTTSTNEPIQIVVTPVSSVTAAPLTALKGVAGKS